MKNQNQKNKTPGIFSSYLQWQLSSAFHSPVFYITALIFSVFISINFYISKRFFTGYGSTDLLLFFSAVPYVSILAIPALCYKRSDSIYNDFIPLSTLKKIFIRYLSILILFSILILLLTPAVLCINFFGDIDYGQFIISLLCLELFGSAVIALTIFIQEIFESPVISFVISAVILAIINSAHLFTTYVKLPEFFNSIFKFLSFTWHFDAAGKGIIDSRDITALLCSTVIFIFLAALVKELKKGRHFYKREIFNQIGIYAALILLMLNGSRWYFRIDCSKTKTYSLSAYTKELLNYVDSQVKITYYRSSSLSRIYPQVRDVSDYLISYTSMNKNLTYVLKDPEKDEKSASLLEDYGIQSQPFVNASKTSTEYTNVYSSIVIEYNGNFEVIPFVLSTDTIEYDLDGRINHLVNNKSRNVNIIVGNGMSLTDDYSYVVPWLSSQGFVCNALFTEDPMFSENLSAATGPLLVIGDSGIKSEQASQIESYILENKGNAVFTVSPYKSNIEGDWNLSETYSNNIADMAENWGVHFTDRITADISCARITMSSQTTDQQTQTESSVITRVINYPLWIDVLPQNNCKSGANLYWAPELELSGNAKPLLYSSSSTWTYEIDEDSPEKLIETNPFILEDNGFKPENKSRILAAVVSGKLSGLYNNFESDKSTVIVIPDQYFLSTLMAGYTGESKNFSFITTTLLKLNGETELAQLQEKTAKNTSLYKTTDETQLLKNKNITYEIIFGLVPLLIIIWGILSTVLLVRKIRHV